MRERGAGQVGEKERVYRELARVRRKCAALRREVAALRRATNARENAALRKEAREYKKALSNIAYRIDGGGEHDTETIRQVVRAALELRGLKPRDRRAIMKKVRAA